MKSQKMMIGHLGVMECVLSVVLVIHVVIIMAQNEVLVIGDCTII